MTTLSDYRAAIAAYIRTHARPEDKFSHQPRLYLLARQLAADEGRPFDDDVLYAAAWLHDLGVFIGHRPEELTALAGWDNVVYATQMAPGLLSQFGFPTAKIPAVVETMRTHLPSDQPVSWEGTLLRDADILEQLGAIGILRTVSKVGRDTRFLRHGQAVAALRRNAEQLPPLLRLTSARNRVKARLKILHHFLDAAVAESSGTEL